VDDSAGPQRDTRMMTRRAVVLGLSLGMLVSLVTYFNDWVIGQTLFIGNFLPISVFGTAVLIALGINPMLSLVSRRLAFRPSELLVATAIALAACGWPSSTLYRYLTAVTALPAHWLKTTPSWQSARVMSYVPGASAELGDGHLQDLEALVRRVYAARDGAPGSSAHQLWIGLGEGGQRELTRAAALGRIDLNLRASLLQELNEALREPGLFGLPSAGLPPHEIVRQNRQHLVDAFPGAVMPAPAGEGVLVDGGRTDPRVVDTLMRGRSSGSRLGVAELPWREWWPTLRLWCGSAFLLGLCGLCMALIVHPQWSKRELLPYPIVRFLREASERSTGQLLPKVAQSKPFWVAFLVIFGLHSINGLHAWFPEIPEIPRKFDFWSLTSIFPNVGRVSGQYGWFSPTIFPSVIAFCFFMATSVSFSLGVAHILFFALGATLIVNGIQLDVTTSGASPSNLLRFGGYVGATLIIGYTGRNYYKHVLAAAFGARSDEAPASATWAMRGLFIAGALATVCLRSAGADWFFAGVFVLLSLMIALVITRVVAETGCFFVQMGWGAAAVVTALLGFDAVGPTAFIVMAMATTVLIPDMREAVMPFLSQGLKMTESAAPSAPARISSWMLVMLVAGFVTSGVVTFYLQYNYSVIQVGNTFATHELPKYAFDTLTRLIADARVQGTLQLATSSASLKWAAIAPAGGSVGWVTLGFALVLGASAARLRLPWWPLHPLAFLVWDTYPLIMFGPSFLMGWMVKAAVVGAGGARAHHAVRPLMIGVIAAELASGLFWIGVGILYFFVTGQRPASYAIFPL
jgi:hypothetical protein